MTAPRVELLSVGTELLLYGRIDTNSAEIGERLGRLGFHVARATSVGDDLEDLAAAFAEASRRAPLVVATGGLGPTSDDRTRDALARAFDRELRLDAALLADLEHRFQRQGRKMPASNRRQAMVPEGGEALPNPEGSACGLWLEHALGVVLALPGPPPEVRAVLSSAVVDRIRRRFAPGRVAERMLRTSGIAESAVEDRLADVPFAERGAQLTILARPGMVEILIRVAETEGGEAVAVDLVAQAAVRLREHMFTTEPRTLAEVLGERLRQAGWTLAVAESCTAGLLGAEITAAAGASDYFVGGVVAYSDRIKEEQLGVPAATLAAHGAVSEETARAMADGVRRRLGADYGLAITGVAGPGGGSPQKPVGTVYHAVAGEGLSRVQRREFSGSRQRVRGWAVAAALDLLRRAIGTDGR